MRVLTSYTGSFAIIWMSIRGEGEPGYDVMLMQSSGLTD